MLIFAFENFWVAVFIEFLRCAENCIVLVIVVALRILQTMGTDKAH